MKTVFDFDDQVPERDVTLFRESVGGVRKHTRNQKEVIARKNIEVVAMKWFWGKNVGQTLILNH